MLLPLAGVVLLFVLPPDKKYNFSFTHDNCLGQGTWIYNRLYSDTTNIDVAFVGSSHTICAINDSLIENEFTNAGKIFHAANIAYCRLGRNLHYTFVNQLFSCKKTKYIVLEVSERENKTGHPEFGYFAEATDVFNPIWLFNSRVPVDIFDALLVRFFNSREKLTCTYVSRDVPNRLYGYMSASQTADTAQLRMAKDKNAKQSHRAKGLSHWFNNRYSFTYIERMKEVALAHKSELFFLYLPAYGSLPEPEEAAFYKSKGNLLVPPAEILNNTANWKDPDHMNDKGAQEISTWISKKLLAFN